MNNDEFEIDAETTRRFEPGLGQTGKTVKIVPIQRAINEYTDLTLPIAYCPLCEYDRAVVTIDHHPELSDEIDVACHVCHTDIVDQVERKERSLRDDTGDDRP